jgi:hypothetical protein
MEDHVGVLRARIKVEVGSRGVLIHVLYSHVEFASLNLISSNQVLSLQLCLRLGFLLLQSIPDRLHRLFL